MPTPEQIPTVELRELTSPEIRAFKAELIAGRDLSVSPEQEIAAEVALEIERAKKCTLDFPLIDSMYRDDDLRNLAIESAGTCELLREAIDLPDSRWPETLAPPEAFHEVWELVKMRKEEQHG